jgi:rhodanese-related sulfurtransferase
MQHQTSGSATPTDRSSRSSPTSYGDTPIHRFPTDFSIYHREDLTTSSATTPVFSQKQDGSDDGSQSLRTLDDVRDQVAGRVAVRAIRKLKEVDGTKITVALIMPKQNDDEFLQLVAAHIKHILANKSYLVAFSTTGVGETSLMLCGSSAIQVQRAALLSSAKFVGRIDPLPTVDFSGTVWLASVHDVGWTSYDEAALWDVLGKAAKNLIDPAIPPPDSKSITQILAEARTRLQRLTPQQAFDELHDATIPMPVLLVDIRPTAQREEHGIIRGSLVIERNVLEWRFDPRCIEGRLEIATRYDLRIIVFCQEGYTSSLAAASLQELGLLNATDIIGGIRAWKEAGLPVEMSKRTWI